MRFSSRCLTIALLTVCVISIRFYLSPQSIAALVPPPDTGTEAALREFAMIRPIDTHAHVFKNDPSFQDFLARVRLTLLNILVIDDTAAYASKLEPERADALAAIHGSAGHMVLCTTFDPYKFADPHFAEQAIRQLNQDFAHGAVAVKLWKNVGMEIRRPDGAFVQPDDPIFEPIYKDIEEHHRTLVAHLAEPDSCWAPPSQSPDYNGYYKEHPAWYMYEHPDHPSKETLLAARDHLLEMNPHLRVVGAHLGSMETDVNQIARRLDKYPNFAVDTAARVRYLMLQPREKVRTFLIKYQDRVLYGTDLSFSVEGNVQEALKYWKETYAQDWKFFATDETVIQDGKGIRGLNLPGPVLRKIFRENAIRWVPGIVK
ncbi:MAG: amidohydrolase family protein [Terriglobia bacterium]